MNIFAKDIEPIKVSFEEDGIGANYEAGAVIIRMSNPVITVATRDTSNYLRTRYNYNPETDTFETDELPRDLRVELLVILETERPSARFSAVLAASIEPLKAETIVRWFLDYPEFFDKCYEAAIQLNPKFAPVEEAPNTADTREAATIKN